MSVFDFNTLVSYFTVEPLLSDYEYFFNTVYSFNFTDNQSILAIKSFALCNDRVKIILDNSKILITFLNLQLDASQLLKNILFLLSENKF